MHGNHITSCDYPSGLQNLIMMTNETDLLCSILHFATVLLCLHFISLTLWTFCAWNVFCCGASALDRLIIIIIIIIKLLWPGDSEGAFWSSPQASISDLSTCLPHTNTWCRLHTVSLIAERQVAKLWIPILCGSLWFASTRDQTRVYLFSSIRYALYSSGIVWVLSLVIYTHIKSY